MSQVDYAKLAKQFGGTVVETTTEPVVDYAKAAREFGGEQVDEAPARHPHAQMTEVLKGAAKGIGGMVFGAGKAIHDYTPIGRVTDAIAPGVFDQRPEMLETTNTPQRIGKTAAEIGSFFTPVGGATRVARAVGEVAKAGGLTLAQTDSPGTAGVAMGLTAAFPGAAALSKLSPGLREGAEKSIVQALGPTKEAMKATAKRIAGEMIDRGVKGSRSSMLTQAEAEVATLGPQIGQAIQHAAAQGTTVSGDVVRSAVQLAKDGLSIRAASGASVPIEGTQAAVKQLDRLDGFIASLGPDIPIEKAQRVKQAWDRIVDKAGFYGPKATASATDNAKAWAVREGASALRKELAAASPDLAKLNTEFSFWKGLKDVLTETEKRTQAHGGGLVSGIGGTVGAISGAASGDSIGDSIEKMLIGGVAGRQVIKLLQSPQWRTMISAPLKNKLADALASGKVNQIQDTARIVVTSLPARLRPAPIAELMPAVAQEPRAEVVPRGVRPQ